jgi:hypothetical protein
MKHKKEFEELKLQKLQLRSQKHGEYDFLNPTHKPFALDDLFNHWIEECQEFLVAAPSQEASA